MANYPPKLRAEILRRANQVQQTMPAKAEESPLEERFRYYWKLCRGPVIVEQHKFCEERKWAFDFAILNKKIAIEIEGGRHKGRHTSAKGFANDCIKYQEAWLHGWTVLRLCDLQINVEVIRKIVERIQP